MINTALFFGSFNPLHKGHIAIAEYVANVKDVDEVWFIVSPQSPFKQDFTSSCEKNDSQNYYLSVEKRLQMLNKYVERYPKFKVCDVELSMIKPSYTIDTLRKLSENYKDRNFILVMGSDQLKDFKLWKEYQSILDEYQIYVYPRSDADFKYILHKMSILEGAPLIDISSTKVREEINNGNLIDNLVPEEVKSCLQN